MPTDTVLDCGVWAYWNLFSHMNYMQTSSHSHTDSSCMAWWTPKCILKVSEKIIVGNFPHPRTWKNTAQKPPLLTASVTGAYSVIPAKVNSSVSSCHVTYTEPSLCEGERAHSLPEIGAAHDSLSVRIRHWFVRLHSTGHGQTTLLGH